MDDSVLKKEVILQGIKVVRDLNTKYTETAKKISLMDDEKFYLQVTMKKIPGNSGTVKLIKIPLPHPVLKDTAEVCLIVGDMNKRDHKAVIEPDIAHYKNLLQEKGVANISEVMTLRQLRTEYKAYEAKQKLLAAYDVFLVDKKIFECVPKVLGRHFFRKRKFPVQVNLRSMKLNEHVKNILSSSLLYITGFGNTCTFEVANLSMRNSEVVTNILSAEKKLAEELPGSWDNVLGLYVKTARSKGIPIYMSFDDPNSVTIDAKKQKVEFYVDELSTIPNTKVLVSSQGFIKRIRTNDDFSPENRNPDQVTEYSSDEITSDNVEEDDGLDTVSIKELKSEKTPKSAKKKGRKGFKSLAVEEITSDNVEEDDGFDTVSIEELKSEKTLKSAKKKGGKGFKNLAVEDSDIKVLHSNKKLNRQKIGSVNNSPCLTPNSVSKKRKRTFSVKNE